MIAGLPIDTWLLMLVSTVPGLALVVMSYRVHRRADLGGGARSGAGRDGRGRDQADSVGRRPRQAQRDRDSSRG